VATEVRGHEERGHSARYLVLIFLVCVATCGVFFSLGFLVGYNERASRSVPTTEVVSPPPLIPPTVNPPPDTGQATPQAPSASQAESMPETVIVSRGGPETSSPGPAETPATLAPPAERPRATIKPASTLSVPAPGNVGEGVTLQVAALRTKQDAEHLVQILKEKGYPVFLVTPEYAHSGDNLYRVQVGPFRTHDDAEKTRNKLSQEGFKPFIRH